MDRFTEYISFSYQKMLVWC